MEGDVDGGEIAGMKRIGCGSVTEALIRATENADRFESVIVVAEGKPGEDAVFSYESAEMTLAQALYLVRCYEEMLMRMTFKRKDEAE